MNAGMLRDRVTIQAEARAPNGQGGFATSWSDLPVTPRVSASIDGISGAETLNDTVQRAVTRWRVVIRKRSDVTPRHRLIWGGLILNVVSAMPYPKDPRGFTLLICESGLTADGS